MTEIELYIGGAWRPGRTRASSDVVDPATEDQLATVPHASPADVDDALAAAEQGFVTWRDTPAASRSAVIRGAADRLAADRVEIASTITRELGKPTREALAEVDLAVEVIRWNAEEGRRVYGRVIPSRPGARHLVLSEPVGPVVAISGWNAPLLTPARKVSGALAAGCAVLAKPSEQTPGPAVHLARAFEASGLPPGVLNMLFGDPAAIAEQLLRSPITRALTFTGSTAVGRRLGSLAMQGLTRPTLELGGHAPVLVFRDADVEEVATTGAAAAFRNAGQVCTSPTRFYVQREVYDAFVERFVRAAQSRVVGDPFDESVQMGPVASTQRLHAMRELTDDARSRGSVVLAGGERIGDVGAFWSPTVLADVDDRCQVATSEPFGPMAVLAPFDSTEEALTAANRLPVGLAAYVFTRDHATVVETTSRLQCGAIAVGHWQVSGPETPFGGHNDSGMGSEGGVEGLQGFLLTKFVSEH